MNSFTTNSTPKMYTRIEISPQEAAQIHWDSIVDVCCGKAKSLTEAKANRSKAIGVPMEDIHHAEALGLAPTPPPTRSLIPSFAPDASIMRMMESINNGGKWGDIWYNDTSAKLKNVEAEIEAIKSSDRPGRWREAVPLYPLQESLRRDLGMNIPA